MNTRGSAWTLRPESTLPRNGAASYLLQWLREGDPVEVDWRKFPERKAEAFPRMQCVDGAWVVEKPNFDALKTIQWLKPWEPLPEAPPRTGFFARGHDPELVREVGRKHPLFPFRRGAIPIGARSDCDDRLYWIPHPDFPFAVVHLTWAGKAQRARPEHLDTEFYRSFEDWQERRMKTDHEFIRESQQKGQQKGQVSGSQETI